MSMTKKDFTLIADVCGASLDAIEEMAIDSIAKHAVIALALTMADALSERYPRFDRDKFLTHIRPDIAWPPPVADGDG